MQYLSTIVIYTCWAAAQRAKAKRMQIRSILFLLQENLLVAIAKAEWITWTCFPHIYIPNDRLSFTGYILYSFLFYSATYFFIHLRFSYCIQTCTPWFYQRILKDIIWYTTFYKLNQNEIIYSSNKIGAADHDAVSTSVAIFKIHLNFIF